MLTFKARAAEAPCGAAPLAWPDGRRHAAPLLAGGAGGAGRPRLGRAQCALALLALLALALLGVRREWSPVLFSQGGGVDLDIAAGGPELAQVLGAAPALRGVGHGEERDEERDEEAAARVALEDERLIPAEPWRRPCEPGTRIRLLLPHVNKAGGRTLEATFAAEGKEGLAHRHVSSAPRSRTHNITLLDHHRSYHQLASELGCYAGPHGASLACEGLADLVGDSAAGDTGSSRSGSSDGSHSAHGVCARWVFALRDPVDRMVSAFYTMTGREQQESPRQVLDSSFAGRSHFFCRAGSRAAALLHRANSSIEEWTNLTAAERMACRGAFNVHVKYLAPDAPEDSPEQLELAKRRLAHMSWFSVLERWPESLQLFSYALGTDLVHYTSTFNLNEYDKRLSSQARRVLARHNELDRELYAFALRLFERRVQAMRAAAAAGEQLAASPGFRCDREVVCWDKSREGPAVALRDVEAGRGPPFATAGERKERLLCSPRRGCWRRDALPVAPRPLSQCLASVLVLGARKGGTTSLYEYLARHPAFDGVKLDSGAQSGELLFLRKLPYATPPATVRERYDAEFVRARLEPVLHSKAPLSREELTRQASAWVRRVRSGAALTGESDVGNGPNCAAPLQVSGACGPDMRLVYLVRSPVERLVSVYRMRRRLGTVADPSLSLDQFARRDLAQMQAALAAAGGANADANDSAAHWWDAPQGPPCLFENDWLNSVWSGLYVVHLARWRQHYDRAAMLVVKSEELFRHPAEVYDDTLRFIGLDPMDVDAENVTATKYNAAPQQPQAGSAGRGREDELAPDTRLALRDFFAPYNLALQERFGVDVSDWS